MKKLILLVFIFCAMPVFAQDTAQQQKDAELIEKLVVIQKSNKQTNPAKEIKKLFTQHERYINARDIDGMSKLYADKYMSFDGFNKEVYLKLADKTWKTYRRLHYSYDINTIRIVDDNQASVSLTEYISGISVVGNQYIKEGYGILQNVSESVYMVEKVNNRWQIVSDNIYSEHTALRYGSARKVCANLVSPLQVKAGTDYIIGLDITPPENTMVIASLAKEDITYPQVSAQEIFRSIEGNNLLERVVKSNDKNLNEYAVTFYVILDEMEENETMETLRMKVSGVGLGMNRVNVIPKNNFITEEEKEKDEKDK